MSTTDSFAAIPPSATADKVVSLDVHLRVITGSPNIYSGRYSFDRLDIDDQIIDVREGNITPHLTGAQLTAIKSFLNALLTKAQSSI